MKRLTLLALCACSSLLAATLPPNFTEAQVVSGISSASAMTFAPDGRLFVCQQTGQLRVIKNGALLPTPFVTVTVDSVGERGLLGVAFDPDFAANQYVYVYYTLNVTTRRNRVSRFTANGDVAVPGSEFIVMELDNLSSATNHNGGAIHFGPDGKLYVAVGENATSSNAQTLANRLGKMLRINPDGSIPADNPFYNQAIGDNRSIWALGLRNPFTFAFQPGTGRMFIDDVGQSTWEEVNDGIAGSNYGWPTTEGPTTNPSFRTPLHAYGHGGGPCAITGGTFYDPATAQFPSEYVGHYFFADHCAGWIRRLNPADNSVTGFATGISSPVDLAVSDDGSLYYLARGAGAVYRIDYSANQPPQITLHPANQTVSVGQPATFNVSASGTPPFSYQWQRNGAPIAGATASSYTLASAALADNGAQFRCVVSNSAGSATSNAATLTVTSNSPPTGTILTPGAGTYYSAGAAINYSGSASDPEDGALPGSAFTWQVDFHHDAHTHPFIPATTGATGGSFTIPNSGETAANVFYRIYLTARDSVGLTHTSYRDILPRTAVITLAASPGGLQVTLDGQPAPTPVAASSVVGMLRALGVVSPQTMNGVTYEFDSWTDGGAATHTITTPGVNTTYTAIFRVRRGKIGNGTGLPVTYFNDLNFGGTSFSRVDPTIYFDWGSGGPAPAINGDTFSARWTGKVQAQFNETYTFYLQSDDGARLWVNGQLLIDNWTSPSPGKRSGSIALKTGRQYVFQVEFYENTGNASIVVTWSSRSTPESVIPRSQLYP